MEISLMSESVVNAGDVEESVTQVLAHFVQGGGEQAAMSVQLLAEQVEIDLGYEKGSLSKWHNFLGRTLRDFFKSKNPASVHTAPQARFFLLTFLSRLLPTLSLSLWQV